MPKPHDEREMTDAPQCDLDARDSHATIVDAASMTPNPARRDTVGQLRDWSMAAGRRWLIPLVLSAVTLSFYRWCGLWPLRRYPNWDWAWIDARSANSLSALRRNLGSGQFPGLDLRTNLGFDYVGDAYPIINPLNLLVGFMAPAGVLWLRTAIALVLGCCGAYYWFRRWTNTSLAVVGALLYLSLPYLTGLHLFTTLGTAPLVLPIVLIATEDLFETVNWRNAFRAWLAFAVSVLLGDINILFSLAPVVIVYGGVYALVVRRRGWRDVLRAFGVSAAIGLTAAAPLLLPLYANSKSLTTRPALEPFLPGPSSGVDVMRFLRTNGLDSLIWPFEGSGLLLYCPAVFVLLGLVGLCLRPTSEVAFRRRIIALVVLAISLFVETLILNNASLLRALGVADNGTRGILRVHLNLLPYLLLLIGVLGCASLIDRIGTTHLRRLATVAGATVAVSVGIDVLVLGIHPTWFGKPLAVRGAAQVPSPTVLRIPRSWDPVVLLVGFHVVAALLLLVTSRPVGIASTRRQIVTAASIGVMAVVVTFGTVTTHLEMLSRSSAEWHWVTDSTYRVDAFRQRRTCIEDLAHVNDPGVRVLYTGGQSLSDSSGRAWANLLETELSQETGQHTLFSYRELDAPIVGVYYGFFGRLQSALLFPPLTDVVAEKVSLLRLLGVRYVVSADATMPAPATARGDFALLGTCTTAPGPAGINGADVDADVAAPRSGAGTSYVYEVSRSSGIFSLACANEVMSEAAALSRASTLLDPAWERGVVWTEQPVANATSMGCADQRTAGEVQVLSEDGSDVNLRVDADRSMALVASYAFRDGWSASLDGHEVPVMRAYGGLMAISVPPGSHSVAFSYRSRSLPVGLAIFALSGSALLVGSMRSRRRPAPIEPD